MQKPPGASRPRATPGLMGRPDDPRAWGCGRVVLGHRAVERRGSSVLSAFFQQPRTLPVDRAEWGDRVSDAYQRLRPVQSQSQARFLHDGRADQHDDPPPRRAAYRPQSPDHFRTPAASARALSLGAGAGTRRCIASLPHPPAVGWFRPMRRLGAVYLCSRRLGECPAMRTP